MFDELEVACSRRPRSENKAVILPLFRPDSSSET